VLAEGLADGLVLFELVQRFGEVPGATSWCAASTSKPIA
jgi:hypothetical protein